MTTGSQHELTTTEAALSKIRTMGGRVTNLRRNIFDVVFSQDRHWTAEDLANEVRKKSPEAHLSTIYRNLDELEKLGLLTHSHLGHGPATYHLANDLHVHLICDTCENSIELDNFIVQKFSESIFKQYKFNMHGHHFAISGLCRNCSSSGSI